MTTVWARVVGKEGRASPGAGRLIDLEKKKKTSDNSGMHASRQLVRSSVRGTMYKLHGGRQTRKGADKARGLGGTADGVGGRRDLGGASQLRAMCVVRFATGEGIPPGSPGHGKGRGRRKKKGGRRK